VRALPGTRGSRVHRATAPERCTLGETMDTLVTGLDRLRLGWLRWLGPVAGPFIRSRELRAAALLTFSIAVAFVLTAVAPLELLALGPIVLGVPHLAADVRYLVVRPRLHTRPAFWIAVVLPLLLLGWTTQGWLGFLAVAGAALTLPRTWSARRVFAVAIACTLAALAWWLPRTLGPVMAHAHNLVAVLFFLAWPHLAGRARSGRWHLVPLALFALATLVIFAGGIDPIARGVGHVEHGDGLGTSLEVHQIMLAPATLDARGALALRLVLFFAFAQSVHYGAWLRVIPEEDRARSTPRTFRASIAALREEGSLPVMLVFVALSLALATWAAVDAHDARTGYLRGALFHGYLEFAVLGVLFASPAARLRALAG
jgi:hypothetical protein